MIVENSGVVSAIQKFSIDDGPGIRTTVFLKGCQLRCPWCHNPETLHRFPEIYFRLNKCIACGKCAEVCPVEYAINLESDERINRQLCKKCMKCVEVCSAEALEIVGQDMTVAEVMAEVMDDMIFYETSGGGVTFSGGEPTTQAGFLTALLRESKRLGLHTCIETNGMVASEAWDSILPYLDLVLLDIKHMDSAIHKKFTGAGNELILDSARIITPRVKTIIRTPLIPGFNDSEDFINQLGEFTSRMTNSKESHLIPYHDYGSSKYTMLGKKHDIYQIKEPLGNEPQRYKGILEKYGLDVHILK